MPLRTLDAAILEQLISSRPPRSPARAAMCASPLRRSRRLPLPSQPPLGRPNAHGSSPFRYGRRTGRMARRHGLPALSARGRVVFTDRDQGDVIRITPEIVTGYRLSRAPAV